MVEAEGGQAEEGQCAASLGLESNKQRGKKHNLMFILSGRRPTSHNYSTNQQTNKPPNPTHYQLAMLNPPATQAAAAIATSHSR